MPAMPPCHSVAEPMRSPLTQKVWALLAAAPLVGSVRTGLLSDRSSRLIVTTPALLRRKATNFQTPRGIAMADAHVTFVPAPVSQKDPIVPPPVPRAQSSFDSGDSPDERHEKNVWAARDAHARSVMVIAPVMRNASSPRMRCPPLWQK